MDFSAPGQVVRQPFCSAWAVAVASGLLMSCAVAVLPETKYPPSLTWRTLTTEHFVIHFHQGEEAIAPRVAAIAEEAHRQLTPILQWEPSAPTQLVLIDTTDEVSGAATPFPYNTIYVNLTPPAGSMFLLNYDDWLRLVISHEYVHVLHLDTVSGLNADLRRVFGRVPFLVFPFLTTVPNAWQPTWMIEGPATHEETELGASDRRDNAFTEMMLRMAVLDNAFPTIDQADGLDRWPAGQVPYLFGARFSQYLANQYGPEVLADISHQYASRPLALWVGSTAESIVGSGYQPIWERWQRSLEARFDEQNSRLTDQGLTASTALTSRGGIILSPLASPDGRTVAYTEQSLEAFPTLRVMTTDGSGDQALAIRNSGSQVSWSPDGEGIAFSQLETWNNYSLYSDLYLADASSGRVRRLTRGLRASDPDFSPDGSRLVFVQRKLGQTRLAVFALANGQVTSLTEWSEDPQYAAPRWSPDGSRIAVAVWSRGRQDIVLVDAVTHTLTFVTRDRAMDLTPSWSHDGRRLYFTSDRTGVFNVFSYSVVDGTLVQTTNVLGGAFTPQETPDGRLLFADYTARGFDVHIGTPATGSVARLKAPLETPLPPAAPPVAFSAPTPYSPLATLAPRFVAPVLGSDEEGTQVGLTTGGLDVLGYHKYSLTALYGTSSHRASYVFSYRFDRLYPSFDLSVADVAALYSDFFQTGGTTSDYWERRQRVSADLVLPIFTVRRDQSLAIGYRFEELSALTPTPAGAQAPAVGDLAGVAVTWRYDNAHEFGYSISPEGGRRLLATAQWNAHSLGSDFDTARYLAAWYEYLDVPRLPHHVLAIRAVGGLANGDVLPQRAFQLGGPALSEELLTDDASTVLLRGYQARAVRGDNMAVGSLEYRFPVWNIERGLTTKPFFFHRLHGAFFVDSGNAWDASQSASDYRTGVGTEVGADVTLAYRLRIRIRAGFAVGIDDGGVTQAYLAAGHAF